MSAGVSGPSFTASKRIRSSKSCVATSAFSGSGGGGQGHIKSMFKSASGRPLVISREITDQNRDEGTYYVNITEAFLAGEEKKGFFGRMFSFGGGEDAKELQIQMERSGEEIYSVSVLDANAAPVDRELGQQLLIMIREFAS